MPTLGGVGLPLFDLPPSISADQPLESPNDDVFDYGEDLSRGGQGLGVEASFDEEYDDEEDESDPRNIEESKNAI